MTDANGDAQELSLTSYQGEGHVQVYLDYPYTYNFTQDEPD